MAKRQGEVPAEPQGPPAKRPERSFGSSASLPRGHERVPRARHVLKALVNEALCTALLGNRAAFKEEVQATAGVRLVLSARNDCFPGTAFRVLGIFAEESWRILRACELMLPKLAELADEERRRPPRDGPELLGKEPGEYIFRFCITKRMFGLVIGSGGSNIKRLRAETGAKIFLDNEAQVGHRLCRVIGTTEQILPCMEQVNEMIQSECEDREYLTHYAAGVSFAEAAAIWNAAEQAPWNAPAAHDTWNAEAMPAQGVVVPPPKTAKAVDAAEGGKEAPQPGSALEEVEGLAETLRAFPPGTASLQYSVSCELPAGKIDLLVGQGGEHVRYVEETTATKIDIEEGSEGEERRGMTVVGQLLNVYTAHALMLLRLKDAEAKEREEARLAATEDPAILKAKIRELEAQLAELRGKR